MQVKQLPYDSEVTRINMEARGQRQQGGQREESWDTGFSVACANEL